MSFTFESYDSLLLPFVAIGAYIGWRRGFWREFGYTLGMALVLLATVVFPQQFIDFVSQVLLLVPRVFNVLAGQDIDLPASTDLFGDPASGRFLLTRVVLFGLLTFLVYSTRYGWAVDAGKPRNPKNNGGRALGAIFGAATGFFWFLALNSFLNALRLLRGDATIPPEGTTLSIPTIPNPEGLVAFVPTMLVVIIIVLAVLAVLRLPRIWQ